MRLVAMLLARFSWRVLALLCAALGLGTVAYLLHGVTGTVDVLQRRSIVVDELSGSLPSATALIADERDRQRRRQVGLGAPRHSWTTLECDLVPRDDGWRGGSHHQVCAVRSVDAYVTAGSASSERCRTTRAALRRTMAAVRVVQVRVVQVPPREGASRCSEGLRRSEVRGPGVRVLDGSVPRSLDRRTPWLVVTTSAPVMKAEVGCSPWTPVICHPAFAEPVLP
jgi:hypothetical protein